MHRHLCRRLECFAISCLAALIACPALAVDGVIEINQQCAVATGCGSGDAAGFPVTIGSGSYRLTSDLDVSGEPTPEDVTAIEVSSSNGTTIDLNGFRILGPTNCPGTPPSSCSPTGTGRGIDSLSNRVTVRNGFIIGMGEDGIHLISAARVEDVTIGNCGGDGIQVTGSGGYIADNVSRRNGGEGISVGTGGLVLHNLTHANIGTGLSLAASTAYRGNASSANTVDDVSGGIQIGENLCGNAPCP